MKNSGQKQLDQILKDKLSEGTAQVPDFVWNRIEEKLFPEKKRRGFFWWFLGGFCSLLIATFIALGLSGAHAHSKQAVTSKKMASREFKTPVSERSSKKQVLISTSFPGTKKESRYRKHRVTLRTSMVSKGAHKGQTSKRKTVYFGSGYRMSFASSAVQKNTRKTPEVTDSSLTLLQKAANETSRAQTERSVRNQSTLSPESENLKTALSGTQIDSLPKADLTIEQLLELIKRDFPVNPDDLTDQRKNSNFSLGFFGGPSLYNSAVFKDYFTSGQLSKRTFASSGFELGFQARFKLGNRFKVYTGLAFNQKQTQFSYNVAITQADYFTYIVNNENVPLENIRDDGMNCFLASDVTARYQMQSVSVSLGTSFEFLKFGKFSAAADVRLSGNVYSALKLKEVRTLDIIQPQSEKFSYLQPGAGILLNYQFTPYISVGLAPFFSKQFYLKTSFSNKMDELVIPLTLSFDF